LPYNAGSLKGKKIMRTETNGGGDAAALLAVWALRSGSEYRAAELLRRNLGSSKEMAVRPQTTKEYASVRLLIGTWDAIGAMVRLGDLPRDKVFETQPICPMWEALVDAVRIIRREKDGAGYAENFEWLFKASLIWMKKNKRKYRSGSCSGIQLLFG
jgi:hypothetical protein